MSKHYYAKLGSKWGSLVAGISHTGKIFGLWFEGQKYFPSIEPTAFWINEKTPPLIREVFDTLKGQLESYEAGMLCEFDLPLEPEGSPFRIEVWKVLEEIPFGQTTTYGEIARKLAAANGKVSMSAQAVGGAIGHNPISIIVPCHRVVGASGQLTGYAGGLDKKAALLDHEKCLK